MNPSRSHVCIQVEQQILHEFGVDWPLQQPPAQSRVQGNAGAFVLPRACLLLRPCPAVAFPRAHLEVSWHLPKGGSFVQTKHILSEGEQEKRNFGNILMENR